MHPRLDLVPSRGWRARGEVEVATSIPFEANADDDLSPSKSPRTRGRPLTRAMDGARFFTLNQAFDGPAHVTPDVAASEPGA